MKGIWNHMRAVDLLQSLDEVDNDRIGCIGHSLGGHNTLYVGALRPWQILIPPGVGHGYKVIGEQPAMLVYLTNRHYDPADEGRIAYNDSGIAYDWELQHK